MSLSAVWLLLILCACGAPPSPDESSPVPFETERRLLHEMFTGSNCGPCLEADAQLMGVLDANPDQWTFLSYPVGSDPYMSAETVARKMDYLPKGEGSYSIPYLHVDGWNELHPSLENEGEGYTDALFDMWQRPSPIELHVTHDIEEQEVSYQIELTVLDDVDSEELVLHAAIIEGVTYQNVGSNGQTEFHNVVKKMLPDANGDSVEALTRGDERTWSGSYEFQGSFSSNTGPSNLVDHSSEHTVEEFEDLSLVVWVQDTESSEVIQSAASAEH